MISWQWYSQWDKGNMCCLPHGPVQIIPYVPTLATCVSTQIHLCCDQIYKNRFLIRAVVSLIFFFIFKYPIESSAVIITCSLKLLVCLFLEFLEFETFSVYPLTTGLSPLGVLQICLHRQMDGSPQSLAKKPFFYPAALLFFLTSSLISSFSMWSLWSLSTKPLSFCHVWEWQGSQVKLTPISIQSKAGPGPRPAVPKSICLPVCQARLLPWPLESSLVTEHIQSIGITSWAKLWCAGQCCLCLTAVLGSAMDSPKQICVCFL